MEMSYLLIPFLVLAVAVGAEVAVWLARSREARRAATPAGARRTD